MRGDALARGARSATFPPAKVSQAKWDAVWAEEPKEENPESKNEELPEVYWWHECLEQLLSQIQ